MPSRIPKPPPRASFRIAVTAALLCMSGAAATTGQAALRLSGAGGLPCRVLDDPAKSGTRTGEAAIQWVLGYLTGRSQSSKDGPHRSFGGPDGIAADTIAYCRAHPDAQVSDAAEDVFARAAR